MVEFLSPGIIITERPSGAQVIQGVSTSNMATVGPTYRGPVNDPTLVTGFPQYEGEFGPIIADALVPLTTAAFFANGGLRAFVNRVVASDAAEAIGVLLGGDASAAVQEEVDDGTGSTAGTADAYAAVLTIPTGSRIVPGSLSVRNAGTGLPGTGAEVGTDDGFGVFVPSTPGEWSGTIDYATGDITLLETGTDVWGVGVTVDVDFQTYETWDLTAFSEGVWGNGAKIRIQGDLDTELLSNDPPQKAFTKYKVTMFLKEPQDDASAEFDLAETFEDIDFDDINDTDFVTDVVNDGTKLITFDAVVTDAGGPATLDGLPVLLESLGDGDDSTILFQGTFAHPAVEPRTVRITSIETGGGGGVMVVTDDGNGNLVGDVDPAGTNTIDYTTGVYDVSFDVAPITGTDNVTAGYAQVPIATEIEVTLTSGTDGVAAIGRNDISAPTLQADEEGMFAFNKVDEILQLIIPDFAGNEIVMGDQIDFAEGRKDVFVIGTVLEGRSPQQAVDWVRNDLGRNTSFAAVYYPWINIADPLRDGRTLTMPPLGHVAGVFARTDNQRNVGKAPAGTQDGKLNFTIGLERKLSLGERDFVFQGRINPLIDSTPTGRSVWGARTLSLESDFRQINARRLFMFVEKSVFNSTHWVVFEGIGPGLFAKIRLTLVGFLLNLFNQGYLAGASPDEAFFVIVDNTNNPPVQQATGLVVIDVGIAPQNPAEFVNFRFQRKTIQAS